MAIDEAKLNAFMGRFVNDLGAVMHAATIVLGDKLGLYKALAQGPTNAEQLASRTGTDARYIREWLAAQAASGYVEFDPATQRFSLSEEQSLALAEALYARFNEKWPGHDCATGTLLSDTPVTEHGASFNELGNGFSVRSVRLLRDKRRGAPDASEKA